MVRTPTRIIACTTFFVMVLYLIHVGVELTNSVEDVNTKGSILSCYARIKIMELTGAAITTTALCKS